MATSSWSGRCSTSGGRRGLLVFSTTHDASSGGDGRPRALQPPWMAALARGIPEPPRPVGGPGPRWPHPHRGWCTGLSRVPASLAARVPGGSVASPRTPQGVWGAAPKDSSRPPGSAGLQPHPLRMARGLKLTRSRRHEPGCERKPARKLSGKAADPAARRTKNRGKNEGASQSGGPISARSDHTARVVRTGREPTEGMLASREAASAAICFTRSSKCS